LVEARQGVHQLLLTEEVFLEQEALQLHQLMDVDRQEDQPIKGKSKRVNFKMNKSKSNKII